MTDISDDLSLPPDDAWIERRTEIITEATQPSQRNIGPGQRITRMVGNLTGAWPRHGRVRHLPSADDDITITEASLLIMPDGIVRAENA